MHFASFPDVKLCKVFNRSKGDIILETLDHWNHANSTTRWLPVQETLRATQVAKNKLEINTNTKNRHKGRGIETDLGVWITYHVFFI